MTWNFIFLGAHGTGHGVFCSGTSEPVPAAEQGEGEPRQPGGEQCNLGKSSVVSRRKSNRTF